MKEVQWVWKGSYRGTKFQAEKCATLVAGVQKTDQGENLVHCSKNRQTVIERVITAF